MTPAEKIHLFFSHSRVKIHIFVNKVTTVFGSRGMVCRRDYNKVLPRVPRWGKDVYFCARFIPHQSVMTAAIVPRRPLLALCEKYRSG